MRASPYLETRYGVDASDNAGMVQEGGQAPGELESSWHLWLFARSQSPFLNHADNAITGMLGEMDTRQPGQQGMALG